jgi:hypothetical protein
MCVHCYTKTNIIANVRNQSHYSCCCCLRAHILYLLPSVMIKNPNICVHCITKTDLIAKVLIRNQLHYYSCCCLRAQILYLDVAKRNDKNLEYMCTMLYKDRSNS